MELDFEVREASVRDLSQGLVACLNEISKTTRADKLTLFAREAAGVRTYVAASPQEGVLGTASLLLEKKLLRDGARAGRVEDVATHPAHRRKGVGKALVSHAVKEARYAGCYKVTLCCTPSDDRLDFYLACGFRESGQVELRMDLLREAPGGEKEVFTRHKNGFLTWPTLFNPPSDKRKAWEVAVMPVLGADAVHAVVRQQEFRGDDARRTQTKSTSQCVFHADGEAPAVERATGLAQGLFDKKVGKGWWA